MRYDKRQVLNNDRIEYRDLLQDRNRKFFVQYDTAQIHFPTTDEMLKLNIITDVWKVGDRLYKYANKYYGDSELWWLIGWFSQKPTDAHFQIGDLVEIPMPLEKILQYFES